MSAESENKKKLPHSRRCHGVARKLRRREKRICKASFSASASQTHVLSVRKCALSPALSTASDCGALTRRRSATIAYSIGLHSHLCLLLLQIPFPFHSPPSPTMDEDEAPQLVDDDHQVAASTAAPAAVAASPSPDAASPAVTAAAAAASPKYIPDPNAPPVPLTILTGWLGAGKTTLLTRILKHFGAIGKQLAIVQNEASSFGVEAGLRLTNEQSGADEVFNDMLEFSNGCVCCAVKSDFVLGVEALLQRKHFDYIVLECSGLADPGPLANLFWVDPELESSVYLDGIVSLVDARNFLGHLRPPSSTAGAPAGDAGTLEAQQVLHQIAYADRVVLNKLDLVSDDAELVECERQIRRINASAPVLRSTRSDVEMERILHINAFDVKDTSRALSMPPPLEPTEDAAAPHSNDDNAAAGSSSPVAHPHDDSIRTWMIDDTAVAPSARKAVSMAKLKQWMSELLWRDVIAPASGEAETAAAGSAAAPAPAPASASAASISPPLSETFPVAAVPVDSRPNCLFRVKAILRLEGRCTEPHFLQAVQELYDVQPGGEWAEDASAVKNAQLQQPVGGDAEEAKRFTRFVFIGRRLDHASLTRGFQSIFVD